MKRIIALLSAGLTFVALGCAMDTQAADETGSLSLELVVLDGVEVDEVDYEISGNGIPPASGTIDTSAPGALASVEVFGLPPSFGEDYTIEMTAFSVDGTVACRGSAEFGVEVGESTAIMVMLNCRNAQSLGAVRVLARFGFCPKLERVIVAPLQTSVGNDIDLAAQAGDEEGDPITFQWTATGGSIADPSAQSTTYTCIEVGDHVVSIQISDDDFDVCVDQWTVAVTCVDGDGAP